MRFKSQMHGGLRGTKLSRRDLNRETPCDVVQPPGADCVVPMILRLASQPHGVDSVMDDFSSCTANTLANLSKSTSRADGADDGAGLGDPNVRSMCWFRPSF